MLELLTSWCQQMTPAMTSLVTAAIEYMSSDEEEIGPSYEDEGVHDVGEPRWVDNGADNFPDGVCLEDGRCDDAVTVVMRMNMMSAPSVT